jgi:hypothetical protein
MRWRAPATASRYSTRGKSPAALNEYGIAAYKVPGFAEREVEWLLSIGRY